MIYTVGHSNRTLRELVALLRENGVTRVVDIRSIPRSAANPQFNTEALEKGLRRHGIGYELMGDLGGRRAKSKTVPDDINAAWTVRAFHNYADYALTAPFRAALEELIARSREETVAILCAEAVWWRCHRRIVADHLIAKRVRVRHVMGNGVVKAAELTPFARVARGRVTYPRE